MSLRKFNIEITETLSRIVTVEASDLSGALRKVKDDYYDTTIILSYKDFTDVKFEEIEN